MNTSGVEEKKTKLRTGYTTGSSATAAAKSALLSIINQQKTENVDIRLPKGTLITEHFALLDSNSQECIGISIKLPLGNLIDTFSVFCWLIIDNNADLDAAVAELPVV